MKTFPLLFALLLSVSAPLCKAQAADGVPVAELFEPKLLLEIKPAPAQQGKMEREGANWRITGDSPLHLNFIPGKGEKWDLSNHRLAGLRVTNTGGGIVTPAPYRPRPTRV